MAGLSYAEVVRVCRNYVGTPQTTYLTPIMMQDTISAGQQEWSRQCYRIPAVSDALSFVANSNYVSVANLAIVDVRRVYIVDSGGNKARVNPMGDKAMDAINEGGLEFSDYTFAGLYYHNKESQRIEIYGNVSAIDPDSLAGCTLLLYYSKVATKIVLPADHPDGDTVYLEIPEDHCYLLQHKVAHVYYRSIGDTNSSQTELANWERVKREYSLQNWTEREYDRSIDCPTDTAHANYKDQY